MLGQNALRALLLLGAALAPAMTRAADDASQPPAPSDPLRFDDAGGYIKFGLEAGVQVVGEHNAFWNLSKTFAPASGYNPRIVWQEGYIKPGVTFERRLGDETTVYGGLSAIGARTFRTDVFDSADQGRLLIEDAYVGLRHAPKASPFKFDLSAGAQPYRIGSGMIIADGGADGFERGALIFGPRRAWANTAIAKASYGPFSLDAFYLDANELKSADTGTRLAGVKAEVAIRANEFAGIAAGQAVHSTAPYPQAAPGGVGAPAIISGGRDGLQFANAYFRWNPFGDALPGFWTSGDLALERNDRIAMQAWAGRAEIGYAFADLAWRPTLSYAYQTFSGDDPRTRRLERFDPLFYDGSPAAWVTGSNGSMVFINSNVNAHRVTLALTPSPQDFITLRYAYVSANELNSPIQYGQATRLTLDHGLPSLVAGVRTPHLSNDYLAEYTRVLSQNAFLTVGYAYSTPGKGLKDLASGRVSNWTGAFANLVIRY